MNGDPPGRPCKSATEYVPDTLRYGPGRGSGGDQAAGADVLSAARPALGVAVRGT